MKINITEKDYWDNYYKSLNSVGKFFADLAVKANEELYKLNGKIIIIARRINMYLGPYGPISVREINYCFGDNSSLNISGTVYLKQIISIISRINHYGSIEMIAGVSEDNVKKDFNKKGLCNLISKMKYMNLENIEFRSEYTGSE